MSADNNAEVLFDIKEVIGVLHESDTGWSKELNLVSWNGGPYKYDIRDWDPSHERMTRGVTLMPIELAKVIVAYSKWRKEGGDMQGAKETVLYHVGSSGDVSECDVHRLLAVLRSHPEGTTYEANIVSWNGREPKLDIRSWYNGHSSFTRGATLLQDEADQLVRVFNDRYPLTEMFF